MTQPAMSEKNRAMLNALTFDVEEYFHVHAFAEVISRDQWDTLPSRVVASTGIILDLLREQRTKATFFVLGCVAERHPGLVRQIFDDGHEIGSHGYAHQAVDTLNREQFRTDVARSLEAIRSACPAAPVFGYRAPSFSINHRTPWAYQVLAELGFVYDSSISPIRFHDRYGVPDAPRFAHHLAEGLLEVPVSTVRILGINCPVAGGGYFRLAPLALTRLAIRRINHESKPAVVYLHPWELDPEQPRIKSASPRSRFRHYVNLRRTAPRLRAIIQQFEFAPMRDVFHCELAEDTAASGVDLAANP